MARDGTQLQIRSRLDFVRVTIPGALRKGCLEGHARFATCLLVALQAASFGTFWAAIAATFIPKLPLLPPEMIRRVAEYAFHVGDY